MSFDILFFPPYDYAGCVKTAVADRIRRHGYRLEICCTNVSYYFLSEGLLRFDGRP